MAYERGIDLLYFANALVVDDASCRLLEFSKLREDAFNTTAMTTCCGTIMCGADPAYEEIDGLPMRALLAALTAPLAEQYARDDYTTFEQLYAGEVIRIDNSCLRKAGPANRRSHGEL